MMNYIYEILSAPLGSYENSALFTLYITRSGSVKFTISSALFSTDLTEHSLLSPYQN